METVLGLDYGTQGVKVLLSDTCGNLIGLKYRQYSFSKNQNGMMEEEPADWVDETKVALKELEADYSSEFASILAIGLCGHMHGLIPLSIDEGVLCPCILWCDTRTGPQMEFMKSHLSEDIRTHLRNPFVTAYTAGKILWLKEHEKQIYDKTDFFLYSKDYIRFLLTGEIATDYSDASGSLLYDFDREEWSREACSALQIDYGKLAPIIQSGMIAGKVNQKAAELFGLREGTPVVTGTGDLAASLLGSGVKSSNEILINLGTAGQILALRERSKEIPKGGYLFKFTEPGTEMILYSITSAAICVRWCIEKAFPYINLEAKRTGTSPYEIFQQMCADTKPGSKGLLFAPYLSGSGSPFYDDHVRAGWVGLDSSHDSRDLARSVLEGVAFAIKQCLDYSTVHLPASKVILTGGGARNQGWCQIFADVLDTAIYCPVVNESTGMGAVRLALEALGLKVKANVEKDRIYQPKLQNRSIYHDSYLKFNKLYPALNCLK